MSDVVKVCAGAIHQAERAPETSRIWARVCRQPQVPFANRVGVVAGVTQQTGKRGDAV